MKSISEVATIVSLAQELFEAVDLAERNVRLLGISLSNLGGDERLLARNESLVQLALF
jgi:DNA polymerase-4